MDAITIKAAVNLKQAQMRKTCMESKCAQTAPFLKESIVRAGQINILEVHCYQEDKHYPVPPALQFARIVANMCGNMCFETMENPEDMHDM